MARIAIMALEGIADEPPVEAPEVTQARVDEIDAAPESEMQEVTAVAEEIEDMNDAIDESSATADTLTDVADNMEATLPEGGMEPAAANAVEVAVEHMYSRLGLITKNGGFALEGFSDKATRVKATKHALEDIKERVGQIYDAIVAAIKHVIETVKNFFVQLFNAAKKYKARAETLKAAAATAKDVQEKDIKANKKLVLDGAYIGPDALAKALTDNHKVIETQLLSGLVNAHVLERTSKTCLAVSTKLLVSETEVAAIEEYKKVVLELFSKWGNISENKNDDNLNITSKATFIGDQVYQAKLNGKFYKPNSYGFNNVEGKKEVKGETVKSLSATQAGAVAAAVIDNMDDLIKYEKQIKDVNKASFTFIEGFKAGFKTPSKENQKSLMELLQANAAVIQLVNMTMTRVRSYEINLASASLAYVASSLSGSKEGKEENQKQLTNEPAKLTA